MLKELLEESNHSELLFTQSEEHQYFQMFKEALRYFGRDRKDKKCWREWQIRQQNHERKKCKF